MSFGEAIQSGFRNYVDFSGRAARSEYWYWILFVSFSWRLPAASTSIDRRQQPVLGGDQPSGTGSFLPNLGWPYAVFTTATIGLVPASRSDTVDRRDYSARLVRPARHRRLQPFRSRPAGVIALKPRRGPTENRCKPVGPAELLRFFFRASGRISRQEYALGVAFIYAVNVAILFLALAHTDFESTGRSLIAIPACHRRSPSCAGGQTLPRHWPARLFRAASCRSGHRHVLADHAGFSGRQRRPEPLRRAAPLSPRLTATASIAKPQSGARPPPAHEAMTRPRPGRLAEGADRLPLGDAGGRRRAGVSRRRAGRLPGSRSERLTFSEPGRPTSRTSSPRSAAAAASRLRRPHRRGAARRRRALAHPPFAGEIADGRSTAGAPST